MEKKESETLEFKKSTSELKEAIISIVSILNKHGKGELYFGIRNNGEVLGQSVSEKTIRDVSKSISDNIEPKIFPKIEEIILESKKCIKVGFSGNNQPYYARGRAYMRVGDEDKQISPQELEKLIKKKTKQLWEEEVSEQSFKDIDEKIVKDFIEKANSAKRIDFKFTNINSVLNKLHLTKEGKLLKAAEVLFCNKNPLEVQAAVFAGKDKLTFLDIKQFKGNIFTLLEQSESYIKEHIDWRAELKTRERKEIPEVPIRAITEALVNSLCHRDYTNPKGNEVAIFKDRIEIYNPGQFPEGYYPEDFIKGEERSILRNPLIANTLYLSKDIEKWGSGIKRIYEACKEEKVKVDFKKLKSGFMIVFYRKEKKEGVGEKVTDRVTEKVTDRVTENQAKILTEISKDRFITTKKLSLVVGISARKIKDNISKLKQKKLLKRIGPAKGGYWEVEGVWGSKR